MPSAWSVLQSWRASVEADEPIAASIYEARLKARMAGALFVRSIEAPETLPQRAAFDAPASFPFLRLPFVEAVRSFLARRVVTPDEFQSMSEEERLNAFTATSLAAQQLVERANGLLASALETGSTLADFIAAMDDGSLSLGIEPENPYYLETLFRTNVQMAYGQGRLEQLDNPDVVAARPYVQYRTAGDNRVRPRHAALDGVIFDRSEDDGWRRYAPPLGVNCRCSIVTLRSSQVDPSQVTHSSEAVGGPDPGWSGPGSAV